MNETRIACLALLASLAGCTHGPDPEGADMRLVGAGNVALPNQMAQLAALGITRNEETQEADLHLFYSKEEMEAKPFKLLAESLGYCIEREPWTPLCDRLWMCDYECVEGDGSYKHVVERLERLTNAAIALHSITDHVDIEEGTAWVMFQHRGETIRWNLKVDDDWLDPRVLERYDELLRRAGSPLRIYGNFSDYGQVAFLAAFSTEQHRKFVELTGIEMIRVN